MFNHPKYSLEYTILKVNYFLLTFNNIILVFYPIPFYKSFINIWVLVTARV